MMTFSTNSAVIGNPPRRQADLIYQATAQYDSDRFTLGANVVGTTDSFAQDANQLKLPAFAHADVAAPDWMPLPSAPSQN